MDIRQLLIHPEPPPPVIPRADTNSKRQRRVDIPESEDTIGYSLSQDLGRPVTTNKRPHECRFCIRHNKKRVPARRSSSPEQRCQNCVETPCLLEHTQDVPDRALWTETYGQASNYMTYAAAAAIETLEYSLQNDQSMGVDYTQSIDDGNIQSINDGNTQSVDVENTQSVYIDNAQSIDINLSDPDISFPEPDIRHLDEDPFSVPQSPTHESDSPSASSPSSIEAEAQPPHRMTLRSSNNGRLVSLTTDTLHTTRKPSREKPRQCDKPKATRKPGPSEPDKKWVQNLALACPFYKLDPIKHHDCLKYSLRTVVDVRKHIQRSHVIYNDIRCPVCRLSFDTQPEREAHIGIGDCSSLGPPAKLVENEADELNKLPFYMGRSRSWYWMWDKIFAGTCGRPESPFLDIDIADSSKAFARRSKRALREQMPQLLKTLNLHLEPTVVSSMINEIARICSECYLSEAQAVNEQPNVAGDELEDQSDFESPLQGNDEPSSTENPNTAHDSSLDGPAAVGYDEHVVRGEAPTDKQPEDPSPRPRADKIMNPPPNSAATFESSRHMNYREIRPRAPPNPPEGTSSLAHVSNAGLSQAWPVPQPGGGPQVPDNPVQVPYAVMDEMDMRMACPFFKFHRAAHLECAQFSSRRFTDVLQHISRKHILKYYCQRCHKTFDTVRIRDAHIGQMTCQENKGPLPGVYPKQFDSISRDVKKLSHSPEKWFIVWNTLFPTYPYPKSLFYDPEWPLGWLYEVLVGYFNPASRKQPTFTGAKYLLPAQWYMDEANVSTQSFGKHPVAAMIHRYATDQFRNGPTSPQA